MHGLQQIETCHVAIFENLKFKALFYNISLFKKVIQVEAISSII